MDKKLLVQNMAAQADLDAITTGANAMIKAFQPFFINLTNAESEGIRSMAVGREGMVREVSKIAVQHIDSLSRNYDPQDLVTKLNYDDGLSTPIQAVTQLLEMLKNTQTANSADIMQLSDSYTANLQDDRKNNAALDEAMKPIDEYNKRFSNKGNKNSGGGGNNP